MTNEEKIKIFQEIYEDETTLDLIFEPDHIEKTYKVDYVEYGVFKAHIECQRLSSDAKKNTATTEPPLKKPHFFQKDNNIVGGENQAGESLSEKKLSPANDGITPATAPSTPHITPVNDCKDDKLNVSDINALIERGNVSDDEFKALEPFIDSVIEILPPPAFSAESEKKVSAILYNVLTHTSFSGFFNGFGIQTFNDLCDTIGIKPNVVLDEHNSDKARQVFSWKITTADYLKILAYTADNFKPRVKNHNDTSTPNFDGSLAYGKEILTPSNEDIQSELAEISHMKIDAKKSLMDTINRLDLRGILASDRRGAGFICPLCGNGSGDSGTGVSPYINANGKLKYHCFKCGFNGSVTDLIASANNLDWNAPRVLAIGKRLLKLAESNIHYQYDLPPIEKKSLEQIPEELDTIAADIAAAQSHLDELPFEDRRGLTLETLQHFGVGYLSNWTHPKSRIGNGYYQPPTRRLIIPTSSSHYLAAMPKRDRDKSSENPKMHAGRKEIFNYADIVPNQSVIIVEGEIDAMSIWQSTGGVRVVAISGAAEKNIDKFLAAKKLSNIEKLEYAFVVLFDNDSTGRKNAEKLVDRLTCAGFPATARFLSDEETKTDANDILIREGDSALEDRINEIISDAETELAQIRESIEKRPAKEEVKAVTAQIGSAEPPPMQDIPLDEVDVTYNEEDAAATLAEYDNAPIEDTSLTAEQSLKKITAALTAEQAHNNNVLRQVALCAVENLDETVDAFINVAVQAGYWHKRDLQRRIDKLTKDIKADIAEKAALHEGEKKATALNRLAELNAMPPSTERNAEIYHLLKDKCLDWKLDIRTKKKLYPLPTFANLEMILKYDPYLRGLLGYDEFADREVFLHNPIWDNHAANRPVEDTDIARLRVYLRSAYNDFACDKILDDCVIEFSRRNAFHRVKEYLEGLTWDGVQRAESLFIDRLGVEDNAYTREVTLKWLLAAIARIYNPACNFQWALTLQGAQGIGKSYLLERLGGNFFTKLVTSFDDQKAAAEIIQSAWIVELEEFSAARRAEINNTKSFLSRNTDVFRPAYGRREKNFRRHCVFAVTVNGQNFLRDMTGNRRFVILECGLRQGNFKGVIDDDFVKQIWAEVMVKYREIFKDLNAVKQPIDEGDKGVTVLMAPGGNFDANLLNLSDSAKITAENIADKYVADDDLTTEIKSFLDIPIPAPCIWLLLTKSERRKFFEEGSVYLTQDDLSNRFETLPAKFRNDDAFNDEFNNALNACQSDRRGIIGKRFYGIRQRENVCAAEIFNECFSSADKRKSIGKIGDVLDRLEDWKQGTRLRNEDTHYTDKKKCYYRLC